MHGMHARQPKNFVLEERLERYADHIELHPQALAGHWAHACWPLDSSLGRPLTANKSAGIPACGSVSSAPDRFARVCLDLGCGKGTYVCAEAATDPTTLWVALDAEPLCVAYTAQHVHEAGLRNVVVVPALGASVARIFGPGELSRIQLNFPTPYPRKKQAARRLVILERLVEYRRVLAPNATLRLRTDSQPLRDFALTQLELASYDVVWATDDERAERPHEATSEYEQRLVAQGAKVLGVWATPSNRAPSLEQTAELSLSRYLPQDLFEAGYVPHGMVGTVVNLRNRRRKGH